MTSYRDWKLPGLGLGQQTEAVSLGDDSYIRSIKIAFALLLQYLSTWNCRLVLLHCETL